jgi:hypothetical protein
MLEKEDDAFTDACRISFQKRLGRWESRFTETACL